MGHPSYAHYQLDAFSLAGRPAAVRAFLQGLGAAVAPAAAEEAALLARVKAGERGGGERAWLGWWWCVWGCRGGVGALHASVSRCPALPCPAGDTAAAAAVLPWDRQYLAARASESGGGEERAEGGGGAMADALAALPEYLRLEGCVEGLSRLLSALMGVALHDRALAPGGWVGPVGGGGVHDSRRQQACVCAEGRGESSILVLAPSPPLTKHAPMRACHAGEGWAPGVRRLEAVHEAEGPLGTVYLDLYRRPTKFPSAAHFTLRCGRADPGAPGGYQVGWAGVGGLGGGYGGWFCGVAGMQRQPPCVCITAHARRRRPPALPCPPITHPLPTHPHCLQLPVVALVANLTPGQGLAHSELVMLLHEFGHALNSLLSRTEFQHLSGGWADGWAGSGWAGSAVDGGGQECAGAPVKASGVVWTPSTTTTRAHRHAGAAGYRGDPLPHPGALCMGARRALAVCERFAWGCGTGGGALRLPSAGCVRTRTQPPHPCARPPRRRGTPPRATPPPPPCWARWAPAASNSPRWTCRPSWCTV